MVLSTAVVLVSVTTLLYMAYLSYKNFEETLVSQTQQQLLTIARTNAGRLEQAADYLSKGLKVLALDPTAQKVVREETPQSNPFPPLMDNFYTAHQGLVHTLSLFDEHGRALYRLPFLKKGLQVQGPDNAGLAPVIERHKPYISRWFYNETGQPSVSISEPIFSGNHFAGIASWTVRLDNISGIFLQPIREGKEDYIWLLDETGAVLNHPDPKRLGGDIMTWRKKEFPGHDWSVLEGIVERMKRGEKGVATYDCAIHGRRIMAYAPVHMVNQLWSIAVFMPYSEITAPLHRQATNQLMIAGLVISLLVFGGLIFYKTEMRSADELMARNKALKQEVSERMRMENALRESEEKLAGIVESVTDSMLMLDEEFNILWANEVAKKLFGLGIVGQKCYAFFHKADKLCENCIVARCFADGGVGEFESEIIGVDGKRRIFWGTASVAATYEDGRPKTVLHLLRDITDHKQAEREVELLQRQIEYILGATKTNLDIIDPEFGIRYIDPGWKKVYGDPAGKKCYQYFSGQNQICPGCRIPKALETKTISVSEGVLAREGNRPVQITTIPFQNEEGQWLVAEVKADITERKQAEEQTQASLKEKETLLKEIHHRVKNNLQIISSLLNLQSRHIKDEQTLDIFNESRNRIKSIALIHEKLYQSKDLTNINFKGYARYLLNDLCRSYGVNTDRIRLKIDVEDLRLGVETAIPCGLIINELVSNSLKHAFPEGKDGEIQIALHSTDEHEIELTVSDNGMGLAEDLDLENSPSLGLKLVNILTDQLGGKLAIDSSEGARFQIKFREPKYRKRI